MRRSPSRAGLALALACCALSAAAEARGAAVGRRRDAGLLAAVAPASADALAAAAGRPRPRWRRQQQQQGSLDYFARISLAGAVSCSATHSLVVPLDVIKTKLQTEASLTGPRAAAASILKASDGRFALSGFFKGLCPTAIGYFLQGACKFGGYEVCKQAVASALSAGGERGEELAERLRLPILLSSAACAEVVASAVLCPLEVVKLRMQVDPTFAAKGVFGALGAIGRTEGFGSLFRGFVPIALRQVPYTTTKLVAFELGSAALLGWMVSLRSGEAEPRGNGEKMRTGAVLLAGLGAGAAAALVSQPFDLLLTRMCGSSAVTALSECVLDPGTLGQLRYLWELGPAAFTGLAPRLAMISTMTSMQFFIYESLRRQLSCAPQPVRSRSAGRRAAATAR